MSDIDAWVSSLTELKRAAKRKRKQYHAKAKYHALASDAWRMSMAGLTDAEIGERLNVREAEELVHDGLMLAHLYDPATLPTTLTAAELGELVALEEERYPTQRQWNALPPPPG